MIDIATIPDDQLRKDMQDSCRDIVICKKALELGITVYSGGSVADRLATNLRIVKRISVELARHNRPVVEAADD